MRREGSPWQGLDTVVLKELADHFDSAQTQRTPPGSERRGQQFIGGGLRRGGRAGIADFKEVETVAHCSFQSS